MSDLIVDEIPDELNSLMQESSMDLIDDIILEDIDAGELNVDELAESVIVVVNADLTEAVPLTPITDGQVIEVNLDTASRLDFNDFVSQNKLLHTKIDETAFVTVDESRG